MLYTVQLLDIMLMELELLLRVAQDITVHTD
jgi:hypothetical protein